MDKDRTRGERRDRTRAYSRRAQRVHLGLLHPVGPIDCICESSVWFFRKRKAVGCRCRGKKRGAPKLPGSAHRGALHGYRGTVRERIRGRRRTRAWLSAIGAIDTDDIDLG